MIIVDANILLELLQRRSRVNQVIAKLNDYRLVGEISGITVLSVSHAFYLAEKYKIPFVEVENLLSYYDYVDVLSADIDWALRHYAGQDFEDALQVAAAKRSGASEFLTLDTKLAKKYQKFLTITSIE